MRRARRIITFCWMFALFYSSPWLVLTHIKYSCVQGYGMVSDAQGIFIFPSHISCETYRTNGYFIIEKCQILGGW